MDLPVEATVHLNNFPDEAEVREILRSHGFELTDLSSNQVRVKGSFLKLKAVKASLEHILNSQTKANVTPVPMVSSGAISKHSTGNSSEVHDNRRWDKPANGSPSSPTAFRSVVSYIQRKTSFSRRSDQRDSSRREREFFVVDADVFKYVERLREKDLNTILHSHDVRMDVHEVGKNSNVTLIGKSARVAAGKLQSLLNDLNKSLRTQEVPLKDMDSEGQALLQRIQKDQNIYNAVLVCQIDNRLHLIGPSGESHELKQRLLARSADQSGRTGRTWHRNPSRRSQSLLQHNYRYTERNSGAIVNLSSAGAAGYSPPKVDKQEGPYFSRSGALRRSHSETWKKPQAEGVNLQKEMENSPPPRKSAKKFFMELFNIKEKKRFKFTKKERK
ncbi:uncharacterized protein si:dkey-154b15.1 [Plectropomus leopardus]|uniref:uncharacterized protein si:dkey-154b15.1 n=1 Tax=Plectropomus leopardus TaxID=160734 RepID=UPI001C4B6C35|nr:uncharacterized protein si:dkey-154b15.1 [Plectropomus leopardus]